MYVEEAVSEVEYLGSIGRGGSFFEAGGRGAGDVSDTQSSAMQVTEKVSTHTISPQKMQVVQIILWIRTEQQNCFGGIFGGIFFNTDYKSI